jgi:hypothetical protein
VSIYGTAGCRNPEDRNIKDIYTFSYHFPLCLHGLFVIEWNTDLFDKQVVDKDLCWDIQTLKSPVPTEVLDTDSESVKLLFYTEFFVVFISSRCGVLLWPQGNQRGKDKTLRQKSCKNEICSKIQISRFRFKDCGA